MEIIIIIIKIIILIIIIIGNAILPETGTKLTKNAVLNFVHCCGAI